MIILILLLILFTIFVFDPHLDIFHDYRGEKHIILWYNWFDDRRFINIIGSQ